MQYIFSTTEFIEAQIVFLYLFVSINLKLHVSMIIDENLVCEFIGLIRSKFSIEFLIISISDLILKIYSALLQTYSFSDSNKKPTVSICSDSHVTFKRTEWKFHSKRNRELKWEFFLKNNCSWVFCHRKLICPIQIDNFITHPNVLKCRLKLPLWCLKICHQPLFN